MIVARNICKTRNTVCPRTSYASGGSGATKLVVFRGSDFTDIKSEWTSVLQGIFALKEFDDHIEFGSLEEFSAYQLQGHVICVVGNVEKDELASILSYVDGRRSSLLFGIRKIIGGSSDSSDEDDGDDADNNNTRKREAAKIRKTEVTFDELGIELTTWQLRQSRINISVLGAAASSSSASTRAFNGQPGPWTKQQFRYLWGLLDGFKPTTETETAELEEGKVRVLQRLASHKVLGGKTLSMTEWDALIRKGLTEENRNDYGIYSLIREHTYGKSLNDAIKEAAIKKPVPGGGNTDDPEEGRSDHLVDATIACIPLAMRENPRAYVKSLLDYGCAEGAITSNLGKCLQLPPDKIFGADVRAIASRDFTYVQLAAENPDEPPSSTGTILPTIADKSISIVNCAMVFHHVTHTKAIMEELRRVIDSTEGLLILREHDCRNAPTGAFLDIVHGLFSLAWKDPVEWPNFVAEYRAFYRSREEWSALLQECGFRLHPHQPASYEAADNSVLIRGKYNNVTRAYYAVYVPDWSVEKREKKAPAVPLPPALSLDAALALPTAQPTRKRPREDLEATKSTMISPPPQLPKPSAPQPTAVPGFDIKHCAPSLIIAHAAAKAKQEYEVIESKEFPGRFYKYYAANGHAEWIHYV